MLVEGLRGGLVAEGFAGSAVECCGDSVEVVPCVSVEVGAVGEVLAEEAVGVVVGAALPWTLGVAEVDVEVGVCAELGMLCHFGALVPGLGAAELLGQGDDRRSDSVAYGFGGRGRREGARCGPVAVFGGLAWVGGVPAS